MTAVSIAINRGQHGFALSNFVIAASSPTGAADIELRYQLLDANSKPLTREGVHIAIAAFQRLIKQTDMQSPAGAFTLPRLGVCGDSGEPPPGLKALGAGGLGNCRPC